jgi:hypothetical protein
MLVYAGTQEAYVTYMSPEAYREDEAWMRFREQSGEKITPQSWLMRDLWDVEAAILKKACMSGLVTVPKKLSSGCQAPDRARFMGVGLAQAVGKWKKEARVCKMPRAAEILQEQERACRRQANKRRAAQRRMTKELDISHFGESFDADEADIDSADRIKLPEEAW